MAMEISAPVGPWDDTQVTSRGGNKRIDIRMVQRMLGNASTRLGDSDLDPGTPDGKIGRVSARSGTLKAIAAYEKKKTLTEDMRLEPGDDAFRALQVDGAQLPTKTISIDGAALAAFMDATMGGHIEYGLGDKASPLTIDPSAIRKIDCSGYVQYLLYTVSSGAVHVRSGSWYQNKYFKDNRFEEVDYATEASKRDNTLRLGYFHGGGKVGHIWFVLNGETIESSGGKGPNRRDWNALSHRVQHCYVIGSVFDLSAVMRRITSGVSRAFSW